MRRAPRRRQQSLLVSHGDAGPGAAWTLDGVDVTDPAALGFADALPRRGRARVASRRAPGAWTSASARPVVQVGLPLRAATRALRRRRPPARARRTPLQSDNLPEALRGRPFLRNRTERLTELGGEAGGPLRDGRLWALGRASAATRCVSRRSRSTTSGSAHARSPRRRACALGRGSLSPARAARGEGPRRARHRRSARRPRRAGGSRGPTHLSAVEDQRSARRRLAAEPRSRTSTRGFRLEPQGGASPSRSRTSAASSSGSYSTLSHRPAAASRRGVEAARAAAVLGLDHELLAGAGVSARAASRTQPSWPGNRCWRSSARASSSGPSGSPASRSRRATRTARSVHDQLDVYAPGHGAARPLRGHRRRAAGPPLRPQPALAVERRTRCSRPAAGGALRRQPQPLPLARPAAARRRRLGRRRGRATSVARVGTRRTARRSAPATSRSTTRSAARPRRSRTSGSTATATTPCSRTSSTRVRGRLGSAGIDPRDPGATLSPTCDRPGLRSPRTHELSAALAHALGQRRAEVALPWRPAHASPALAAAARPGAVRLRRSAARSAARCSASAYDVGFYAPASESRIVPGQRPAADQPRGLPTGRVQLERPPPAAAGRASLRALGRVHGLAGIFEDAARAMQDPTSHDVEPLQDARRRVAARAGRPRPRRRVRERALDRRRQRPRAAALAASPRRAASTRATASRSRTSRSPTRATHRRRQERAGRAAARHLPPARARARGRAPGARSFPGRPRPADGAAVDVFNLLNRATTLQIARDVELPSFGRPREILRPRIVRIGLEYGS